MRIGIRRNKTSREGNKIIVVVALEFEIINIILYAAAQLCEQRLLVLLLIIIFALWLIGKSITKFPT